LKLSYRKLCLLLVDASQMALDSMESQLEPLGFFRLWTAGSADEALEVLNQRPVALMITAWKMQPISGLQLVQIVRRDAKFRELPILLLAEQLDPALEKKAREAGATAILKKPVKGELLVETVEKLLEAVIDPREEDFLQHMAEASRARREGDLEAAERAYRAALEVKSDEKAELGLAAVLQAKGDLEGAEKAFIAALKANPGSLQAYLGLAGVYQEMGRLADALKVCAVAVGAAKKIKESGAAQAVLYYLMGELEIKLKHLQKALGHFDRAVELDPGNSQLPGKIGDVLMEAGFLEQAEGYYQRALELDPELAHIYNRLGIVYRRQGKHHRAISLYQKALVFHPDDEHLFYNMAVCHWDRGEYPLVIARLEKALELNPGFKEAKQLMAAAKRRLEEPDGGQGREKPAPTEPSGTQPT